jgi:hypothetical protein
MKQYQIISAKTFDKIVRENIDTHFKIEYITDERLPKFYKEEVSEQELKKEVYKIFFESFDEILQKIGIPLKRRQKLVIRAYWYNLYNTIESHNIQNQNFPGIKFDEDKDIKIKFRLVYLYFYYNGTKYKVRLDTRIDQIYKYVFTKNFFGPAFEQARGMKQKTDAERIHDGIIEWDMYSYTKRIAELLLHDMKSYQNCIWKPHFYEWKEDVNTTYTEIQ